ncbi:arabinose efflux permease [Komagataeibacter oboediens DSM 11826]|nr:arabinose efflux permease [Komagataeibacter oboediens DSM 11826]
MGRDAFISQRVHPFFRRGGMGRYRKLRTRILPVALLALAIGAFGLGTTETIVMGLLPQLSSGLHVTIAQAGLLVSGYAIGVTIASPLVAILTNSLSRRATLLLTMAIFIAGNACSAMAPGYVSLMLARVLTSFSHGTFYGAASIMAAQVVPPAKRAEALSLVYIGLTLAMILGVPMGTVVAQMTSWRMAFWLICAVGVLAWTTMWLWIPQDRASGPVIPLSAQFKAMLHPLVVTMMLVSMCTSSSMFTLFTYITPFLQTRSGFSTHAIDGILLMIGGGLCLGNLLGGRLADWKMLPSCAGLMAAVAMVQILLVPGSLHPWVCLVLLFLWGVFIYAPMAPLQTYVVACAGSAPNIAAVMNQSSFNFGNAIGAWAGSHIVDTHWSYGGLPVLSSCFAFIGFALVGLAEYYVRRQTKKPREVVPHPLTSATHAVVAKPEQTLHPHA